MSIAITTQQQKVLDFLSTYFVVNDALPNCAEIAHAFGFASNNAASDHIQRLAKKGYLEKNEAGNWRFSRQQPHPGWTQLLSNFAKVKA